MRPVVGITGNSYLIDDSYPVQSCGLHNIQAMVEVSDAAPLIVPSMPGASCIDELCVMFDGFVFTGARPNVHPEEFGEKPTEAHG